MLQDATQMLRTELEYPGSDDTSVWHNLNLFRAFPPQQHPPRSSPPLPPSSPALSVRLDSSRNLGPEQRSGPRKFSVATAMFTDTHAPINKLPPEILGMIPAYQAGQTAKDLVTVSSVCSHWRNTFLATPSLWTKLDGKGIERTRVWLKRSRSLPIQLWVEGSPDPKVLEYIWKHPHGLEVVGLPDLDARNLPLFTHGYISKLLRPTPSLRHICVEVEGLIGFDTLMTIAGDYPSLEVLHLMGVPVSIKQFSAPNLRQLSLTGEFGLAKILDLLDSFPLLECLAFRLHLQEEAVPVSTERKVVLGRLSQANFFYHGFRILQHLSLPVINDLKLIEDIPVDQLGAGTTNDYTRFLSRAFDDLPMSRQINTISFYTKGSCRILFLSGPNGGMELVTHKIDNPAACITLLHSFVRHSFESLQSLSISNLYVPLSDIVLVSDFLKLLTGLQSLMMQQSFASQCLLALGTDSCLQLQDIEVQRPSPWLLEYSGLMKFVQDRSEAGIPIQRLVVSNSFPAPLDVEDMKTLLKYVKYVAWH